MKIGLISDTHSYLDKKVAHYFKDCDEIWHAGDIGSLDVISELEKIAPVRAVFGNIDDKEIQSLYAEDLWFECEGLTIWLTHIGGAPPNYNPRIKKILKGRIPRVFICGHSHILRVKKDASNKNMIYINPGAAGNQGFHQIKTIMRFEITAGEIKNLEVIELGKRGEIISA